MAATERVLLDTNVVLAAYDPSRGGHLIARSILESDPRDVVVTPQVLREFLNATTRPAAHNGYGLGGHEAGRAWRTLTSTAGWVEETAASSDKLLEFVEAGLATGKQVHDANLIAVALEHDATTLITHNVRHFERFAHLIAIEPLVPA